MGVFSVGLRQEHPVVGFSQAGIPIVSASLFVSEALWSTGPEEKMVALKSNRWNYRSGGEFGFPAA